MCGISYISAVEIPVLHIIKYSVIHQSLYHSWRTVHESMQDYSIFSTSALDIQQFSTKPSKYSFIHPLTVTVPNMSPWLLHTVINIGHNIQSYHDYGISMASTMNIYHSLALSYQIIHPSITPSVIVPYMSPWLLHITINCLHSLQSCHGTVPSNQRL